MSNSNAIRLFWSLVFLGIVFSNFWSMRTWTERTGVYDDICYLRQAHLFQRFGAGGIDTNLNRDDDGYFANLAKEIGYAEWNIPSRLPCHTHVGEKRVIQYPPGTGFALSMFPAGVQRVSLYALANVVTLLAALVAVWSATSRTWILLAGIVGSAALYFMINPAKASFSMAPTMAVCAICGYLTNILADAPSERRRLLATAGVGLLLGLAVSFRLPNLFLSAGYFMVLLALAFKARDFKPIILFGLTFGLGLVPTLVAHAINAGSVFRTTYSASDAVPRDFTFRIALEYLTDMQGPLIILIVGWAALSWIFREPRTVASIVLINLATNLLFFLSHPIFTPYYLMPLAMLSLWTLAFHTTSNAGGATLAAVGKA
jgi:hypothetical protein